MPRKHIRTCDQKHMRRSWLVHYTSATRPSLFKFAILRSALKTYLHRLGQLVRRRITTITFDVSVATMSVLTGVIYHDTSTATLSIVKRGCPMKYHNTAIGPWIPLGKHTWRRLICDQTTPPSVAFSDRAENIPLQAWTIHSSAHHEDNICCTSCYNDRGGDVSAATLSVVEMIYYNTAIVMYDISRCIDQEYSNETTRSSILLSSTFLGNSLIWNSTLYRRPGNNNLQTFMHVDNGTLPGLLRVCRLTPPLESDNDGYYPRWSTPAQCTDIVFRRHGWYWQKLILRRPPPFRLQSTPPSGPFLWECGWVSQLRYATILALLHPLAKERWAQLGFG